MKYTLVISRGQDGFLIGQLKELPDVFTQGLTVAELKENIADALEMYFEDMRENYQTCVFSFANNSIYPNRQANEDTAISDCLNQSAVDRN